MIPLKIRIQLFLEFFWIQYNKPMGTDKADVLFKSIIKSIKEGKVGNPTPSITIMDTVDALWNENKNSDVIAALINQEATGTLFLKKIEERFCNTVAFQKEESPIKASRENAIKDENAAGRTDINICSPNYRIIIENKILSGDGNGQLRKYIHYWEKKKQEEKENKTIQYCYLTLWGTNPSERSLWGNDPSHSDSIVQHVLEENRFICISYRTDILGWLEEFETHNKERHENDYLLSAVNQYKGAIIQMVQQDLILGAIRHNKDIILSLNDIDYETFLVVVARLKNLKEKLRRLHDIRDALAIKLNENQNLAHLAKKLRFTINQSALFENFTDFEEECLSSINPTTYLGLICCSENTSKCYGIGYEFTNDYTKLKRKIGIMLGGKLRRKNNEYWDKADNIVLESCSTTRIVNDLLMRIEKSKELYSI